MLLVIDFECTCEQGNGPDYHHEIIEIGAVWVSANHEVVETMSVLVQTQLPLSEFCTQLTGITQADIDQGQTLAMAIDALAAFAAKHPGQTWGSWGVSDLTLLTRNCETIGRHSPLLGWEHHNLKAEFAKRRKIKQVGMKRAMSIVQLEPEGAHHRALDDALNIARLLRHT